MPPSILEGNAPRCIASEIAARPQTWLWEIKSQCMQRWWRLAIATQTCSAGEYCKQMHVLDVVNPKFVRSVGRARMPARACACVSLGVLQAGAPPAFPDARVAGEAEEVVGVRGERHVASRRANSGRRRRTSARASARAHRWAAGRRALECRQAGSEWGGRRPPSSQVWRRWTANLQQCSR